MKILVLTNLYPPHVVNPGDLRVGTVCDALRQRGHQIRVVTSRHGMGKEYSDGTVDRTLWLNGVFDQAKVTEIAELTALEEHNHAALDKVLEEFQPEVIFLWSLRGLGKALLLQAAESEIPYVLDVAGNWIVNELPRDPWLVYWNSREVPLAQKMFRLGGAIAGRKKKVPTAILRAGKPVKGLFDSVGNTSQTNHAFLFPRLYFCTPALKRAASAAGFSVDHAEVIPPGISASVFHGEVKSPETPVRKFVLAGELEEGCGAEDAIEALQLLRQQGVPATLNIFGQGDSNYIARLKNVVLTCKVPVEFKPILNPQNDLPRIFREHDAFIYAAHDDAGWVPGPLQAMACGLPVIASRVLEQQEFFRHRHNCLLSDPGDIGLLGGRMLELTQDAQARWQLADTGQTEAVAAFDEGRMVDKMEVFLADSVAHWKDYHAATAGLR